MREMIALFLMLAPMLAGAQSEYLVDWDEVGDEAVGYMVDLVRIDSSNPPGNETQVANYIRDV
ncbi:MAG TPA: hypothetical protein VLB07_15035, partial [Woeseiaceae bacterium]|nr:hypothetical protein [Woeseiaceae bacterium]